MNADRIKEILAKIPITLLLVGYLGYLGWDYYEFTNADSSPLQMKKQDIEGTKTEIGKLQTKVKEGEQFLRSLDAKRSELRRLAGELDSMKGTLTENLDLGEFMKIAVTEARKVGLTVVSLRPGNAVEREYYAEQPFDLQFRGVYVQLLLFLDRMSNVQRIVRVDNFDIRRRSSSAAKFVELEGAVQMKAYRYLASKADAVGRDTAASGGAAPAGGGASAPAGNPGGKPAGGGKAGGG